MPKRESELVHFARLLTGCFLRLERSGSDRTQASMSQKRCIGATALVRDPVLVLYAPRLAPSFVWGVDHAIEPGIVSWKTTRNHNSAISTRRQWYSDH